MNVRFCTFGLGLAQNTTKMESLLSARRLSSRVQNQPIHAVDTFSRRKYIHAILHHCAAHSPFMLSY